jgi:hypothetical protein
MTSKMYVWIDVKLITIENDAIFGANFITESDVMIMSDVTIIYSEITVKTNIIIEIDIQDVCDEKIRNWKWHYDRKR